MELKEKTCTACEGNEKPFTKEESNRLLESLNKDWVIVDNKMLKKQFPFENFKRGMAFAQEIAMIAEQQNHHPDLSIHYDNVEINLSTHAIGGLSENDFIMADKIDNL